MNIDEDRIAFLKQRTLEQKARLKTERMQIIDNMKVDKMSKHVQVYRAQIFAELCEKLPLCIDEEELIVGALSSQINTAQLYAPDSSIEWLKEELEVMEERAQDTFLIDKEDEDVIRKYIKKWKNKSITDEIITGLSKEAQRYLNANVFFIQKELGYGHCLADYEYILQNGFLKTMEYVNDLYSQETDGEKKLFYESIHITLSGAVRFIERYQQYADKLASEANDSKRRAELHRISAICHKLSIHHAESFHEALQCIWFLQLLIHLESDGTGVSFGRLDQYLYPYYRFSKEEGEKQETLQTLLDMFWIKTNHLLKCRNAKSASLWSGYIMNQNVTIGGIKKDGSDACNDVTMMCLLSQEKLTMKEPQFSLRIHTQTSQKILDKALDCICKGGGKPQFVSDKIIKKAIVHMGVPEENAWDYAIIGCIEPSVCGGFNRCKSGHINLIKVLELALYDGYDPITDNQIGPHSGKLEDFKSFQQFYSAFQIQFHHMLKILTTIHQEVTHEILRNKQPHPFLSLLTKGCLRNGRDITNMGALWNWTSFSITGMANLCDSMYAIDQACFVQKRTTSAELITALQCDFKGYEELLHYLKALPKYGNGDYKADHMAKHVSTTLYEEAKCFRGHGDTSICFGYVTVTKNVSMGKSVGATPDGRKAFSAFADGISPVHGCDWKGPLAVLRSSEALQLEYAAEGAILNQKFLPSILSTEKARKEFAIMIKLYLTQMNGMHIQYNMVSVETLLSAQKNPERYRDLLVRVSGYSAYFIELSKEVQQDVIERTQY